MLRRYGRLRDQIAALEMVLAVLEAEDQATSNDQLRESRDARERYLEVVQQGHQTADALAMATGMLSSRLMSKSSQAMFAGAVEAREVWERRLRTFVSVKSALEEDETPTD